MAGHTKRAAVLLATLLCGAVFAAPQAQAAETTATATEAETAVVRVTIEQADGTKLRATKVVRWGATASFDLADHDLDLSVADRHHLSVRYTRDGSKVADRTFDAQPSKSLVVYDDAGAKVVVRVIPTKVHIETSSL